MLVESIRRKKEIAEREISSTACLEEAAEQQKERKKESKAVESNYKNQATEERHRNFSITERKGEGAGAERNLLLCQKAQERAS
ncbi:hypothetical protein RRG08_020724 [Elysia crispata]|uniref:Uncharacterized protein n=1 Tax=Elysia crispata TaxID=231223 RepID=A0AAE0Z6U4_9GAST|nr:hypothetical protein RRG08_020724 [Elysia crispata]